jgi:putative molybdopterin biosynthesis protein
MVPVGSMGGITAIARGEADVAGVHLMDEESGEYNVPFLPKGVELVRGYRRRQGVVFRTGDVALAELSDSDLGGLLRTGSRRMVNRNQGSGTRVLIDELLAGAQPPGYLHQAKTHHAVAAAVAQGRADWGVTLDTVAAGVGLEFRFLQDEQFDLAIPAARRDRPAVRALCALLEEPDVVAKLGELGFAKA